VHAAAFLSDRNFRLLFYLIGFSPANHSDGRVFSVISHELACRGIAQRLVD
jgi:hypothetical protein